MTTHRGTRRGAERGASSVETAIALPVLIMLVFGIVQGAVVLHAGNVAQGAAQAAVEEARLYGADLEDAAASGFHVAASSGSALTDVTIDIAVSETTVVVTVRGTAPSLVPGMPLDVQRTVSGPIERWVP